MLVSNRAYLVVVVVAIFGFVVAGVITQIPSARSHELGTRADSSLRPQERESQLDIVVKVVDGENYSTENIPLEIVFTNVSSYTINLLDAFDTSNKKRIFLTVTLRDGHESPFFTSGGGKISFSKNSMKYIELKKGEQTSVRINLIDYDLPHETLKAGLYSVLVTYRNQYGEDCFKGTVTSQPLNLVLNKF